MTQLKHLFGAVLMLALIMPVLALAQDEKERGVGNVVYVPTPQVVVDEMLRMAKVGSADFVIDLGSGDGRMIRTAAKKFGARGFGVDLSDDLSAKAMRSRCRKVSPTGRASSRRTCSKPT
jgi:SAM-dependent methyltransferase